MKNIWTITKRELLSYFTTPIGFLAMFVYIFLTGGAFTNIINQEGSLLPFSEMMVIVLFITPFLTMKLIAEEKKQGTIELLFTSPVSSFQIIFGKFLASILFFLSILGVTFIYLIIIIAYSKYSPPDYGAIITGYLGVFFFALSMISVGIAISSITDSQVIAVLLTFGISFLLLIIDSFTQGLEKNDLRRIIYEELSLINHNQPFHKGLIQIKDIIYYSLWTILCLFTANVVIEGQRS